ncbi:MAG: hypothetical protein HQ475_10740 [SAR202 cluster bacterium]|nr:hypothetical protein [SAR202 cluster bacterium]
MFKKILTLALASVFIFSIACGSGDSADPQSASPTVSPTVVAPEETALPTPLAPVDDFFLQLVEPAETEVFTDSASFTVVGRTRVDAVVTVNDTIVEPNIDGEFSLAVVLDEGPNIIEVVASVASGEQQDLVLVAIYLP